MLRLYVLVLGETGGRCESEALWLTWEDIDLEGGFVRVVTGRNGHRTKAGKGRWVPMTPRLATAMREHFMRYRFSAYDGKPWVLHHDRTALRYKAGDRIKSLYDGYRRAAERAKLPDRLTQHNLRQRRVTEWFAEGKSPVLVKEAMGHSDIRTTMGYTHLAKEHLRALVDAPVAKREEAVS